MLEDKPYLLTLSVLALPAVATLCCFVLGRSGGGIPARRLAIWFCLFQVGLTAFVALMLHDSLSTRVLNRGTFNPLVVPGDVSDKSRDYSGSTTWDLITIGSVSTQDDRIPPPSIQFYLGVDGLNVWLLLLTSVITLCAVLLTNRDGTRNQGAFLGWLFMIETASIGVFLSFDVILFFAFFETTLIPGFFLIGQYGVGGGKRDAARNFFLYTLLGGAFTLVAILGLVAVNPTPITSQGSVFILTNESVANGQQPVAGPVTFSIPRLIRNAMIWDYFAALNRAKATHELELANKAAENAKTPAAKNAAEMAATAATKLVEDASRRRLQQTLLFFAIMAGFAVKLPIIPFHTWLPAAYGEAPVGITMFLSAVLAKLGAFGILRLAIPLCPAAVEEYGMRVFGSLAAIGIVYAAFCAYGQKDIKRLVAYSSVSHLGLLVLGAFSLTTEGIAGSSFHIVAHGVSTGMLFGLLAFLFDRYGTLDVSRYGGLFAKYPKYTFFFILAAFASVGLPGLSNFVGEMLCIAGVFANKNGSVGIWPPIAACAGIFLSVWYTFTLVRNVFFGPVTEPPIPTDGNETPAKDVTAREAAAFILLTVCILLLGIFPQYVLDTVRPEAKLIDTLNSQAYLLTDNDRLNADRLTIEAVQAAPRNVPPPQAPHKAGPNPADSKNKTPATAPTKAGTGTKPADLKDDANKGKSPPTTPVKPQTKVETPPSDPKNEPKNEKPQPAPAPTTPAAPGKTGNNPAETKIIKEPETKKPMVPPVPAPGGKQ